MSQTKDGNGSVRVALIRHGGAVQEGGHRIRLRRQTKNRGGGSVCATTFRGGCETSMVFFDLLGWGLAQKSAFAKANENVSHKPLSLDALWDLTIRWLRVRERWADRASTMLSVSIAKAIPGKPGSGQRQVVQPSCVSLVERVRPHVI
jgi:hypothetical protein